MAPVRNGIVRDVRQQLFNKMMALPLSYFSEEKKGDLMSRITTDVMEIEWSILNVLEAFFREPLIMFGCLGLMIYLSPALTMFVFVLIIFTAIIIGGIGKTLKKKSSTVQEKLGSLVSIVEEGLSGLRIIKGFNAEKYQEKRFYFAFPLIAKRFSLSMKEKELSLLDELIHWMQRCRSF